MSSILILMAAYNGRPYIGEQIDSILAQDCDAWHLIVSDDGSDDGTADVLSAYAARYPQKITRYTSENKFGAAREHFLHLLQSHHDADYVMFCDQDDVWHPDKISCTLKKMQEIEENNLPALVFTDMCVTDRQLQQIHHSFLAYSGLYADRCSLSQLLMQNVASGNTIMINAALVQTVIGQLPDKGIIMHDWWFALVAAAMGRIGFVSQATCDYRQHGDNVIGAKNVRSWTYIKKRASLQVIKSSVFATSMQAEALLNAYEDHLDPASAELLTACARIHRSGWFARKRIYLRYKLFKSGTFRVIAQFLFA